MQEVAYLNGRFCRLEDATVSIEDRGFQFADGVYEVLVAHHGQPFRLAEHMIRLERSLCPAGCQACADICPSHALVMGGGHLLLDDRFCIYCGACAKVCPVPEALQVKRHRVRHTPIKSGAWIVALEKLISADLAAEELELKSQAKRRKNIQYLPGAPKEK